MDKNNLMFVAQTRIEALNQAIRTREMADHSNGYALLGIAVLSIAVAVVTAYLFKKRSERIVCDARKLFKELCRAHHLSWSQRRLLNEMARVKNVSDPTLLMIDQHLWVIDPVKEMGLCQPKMRKRLQIVQRLLFASDHRSG
jgi:hypothetical protein